MVEKFLQYLEKHPLIRGATILSVIIGLVLATITIISWFKSPSKKTEENLQKILPDSTVDKEYFIPSHKVLLDSNSFITVRNKILTKDEISEIDLQTAKGKVLDAATIIGRLVRYSSIKLIENENSYLKVKYWDDTKVVVGFIPEKTQLKLIEPLPNNPYGIGNGQISVYTTLEIGVEKIIVDDELVGTLNYYYSSPPNCNETSKGVFKIVKKAGEHIVRAEDRNGMIWTFHVTLSDKTCNLIEVTD